MKFGMMKYHIMTFKNKVVAPSSGTGAILKKPQNLFVKYLKKDNMLTVANWAKTKLQLKCIHNNSRFTLSEFTITAVF